MLTYGFAESTSLKAGVAVDHHLEAIQVVTFAFQDAGAEHRHVGLQQSTHNSEGAYSELWADKILLAVHPAGVPLSTRKRKDGMERKHGSSKVRGEDEDGRTFMSRKFARQSRK